MLWRLVPAYQQLSDLLDCWCCRTYLKLPGDHVALIRLDLQRLTSAIGEWLETVKVREQQQGSRGQAVSLQ